MSFSIKNIDFKSCDYFCLIEKSEANGQGNFSGDFLDSLII